jgi:hypothetical protein
VSNSYNADYASRRSARSQTCVRITEVPHESRRNSAYNNCTAVRLHACPYGFGVIERKAAKEALRRRMIGTIAPSE